MGYVTGMGWACLISMVTCLLMYRQDTTQELWLVGAGILAFGAAVHWSQDRKED